MLDVAFEWLIDWLSDRDEKRRGVIVLRWVLLGGLLMLSIGTAAVLLVE